MSAPGGGPALIAGYRVLRRLGSSDRADLYVGVAPARSSAPGRGVPGQDPGGPTTPVVLKVFHPATEDLSVEREVRALTTLTPGRLSTLFDVGTLPDGRICLVLEQLTGGTLSGFLQGRRQILPGEAVTVLAPVAAALAELQAIDLLHPGVNLSTILFAASGRPVLIGLGELRALPEPGCGRTEAFNLAHSRLAQVVRTVLDQVEPGESAPMALRDLDRWCAGPEARSAGTAPGELERLLFAWAEAGPVRLGQDRAAGTGLQSAGDWLRRPGPDDPAPRRAESRDRVAAKESGSRRMLGSLASRSRAAVRRLRAGTPAGELTALLSARLRVRRGPLLLAAVLAVVSTGSALTALGPAGSADTGRTRPNVASEPAEVSGLPSPAPGASTASGGTGAESDGTDGDNAAVSGDDPAAAVSALLRIRAGCLVTVSVVCLDGVHQSQSAALAADGYTLRQMQQGGGTPEREDLASWAAVLVERTGDVALVSLQAPDAQRQPASVLVVKGEAGWRIRDIFDY